MSGRDAMLAIPAAIRREVDQRDAQRCRLCGQWAGDARQLHHILFGGDYTGMGGRRLHVPENIVTLDLVHHDLVHSSKGIWIPLLEQVIRSPGQTAFALRRRALRRAG